MSEKLTNEEQLYLSKLVYYDIGEVSVNDKGTVTIVPPIDITLFAAAHFDRLTTEQNYVKNGDNSHLSDLQLEEIHMLEKVINGEVLKGYELVDMRNENMSTGFVGAVFEDTETNEAVVAFRGSETSEGQLLADWILADAGLIALPDTGQQKSAENYMEYINNEYGDKYSSFELTGHSLGGNLTFHAAITAPKGLYDKIKGVYNLDGPGYTDEDYLMYKDKINDLADKGLLKHYAWTMVGTLFSNGEPKTEFVDVVGVWVGNEHVLESLSLSLNESGNFKTGWTNANMIDIAINGIVDRIDRITFTMPFEWLENACESTYNAQQQSKFDKDNEEHIYVNEAGEANEQAIIDYLNRHVENKKVEYLVRGALLKCSAGTYRFVQEGDLWNAVR